MRKVETDWHRVPVIFDLSYAAALLGISLDCIHKLAQQGRFPAFKVGKLWRVRKDDLTAYIERQTLLEGSDSA
ncbi:MULTISPECIES: helix-turn-helix domain-containing protein [Caproicibacterium]|uniref:Helix-turn-helix domain-containing protein n=1 Tax=Caproicibacterium argilliputei TaxID=3030016 RepID=A0AA97DBW9_9FIRM|nr:helix-turn-helix domain-containing protein [Caproicibacterium argilliputei]WOC33432.1 helix-turn-helix domain-containing protein [Caproicibacterium argilliputei]